jgi:hypothetical protein
MKLIVVVAALALLVPGCAAMALQVRNGPLTNGTVDWLADLRFRNFQTDVSGDYEMMICNVFDDSGNSLITSANITTGQLPNFAYNRAAWATNNEFWITYDPETSLISLRLKGSGAQAGGATGGYDMTISRAPDACVSPVNYILFQLWDRDPYPTFTNGLSITSLDGTPLGTFTIPSAGIGSWSIFDPGGSVLNDGFVLQGTFDLDLDKLTNGREGDKIVFKVGNFTPAVPELPASINALAGGLVGLFPVIRRRLVSNAHQGR